MLINHKATKTVKDETIREVCGTISATMGSNGKVVVCDKNGIAHPTKDGVTVARAMRFGNPEKDIIASMIAECCIRTDTVCGDGTTTTAFLLKEFYTNFNHQISYRTKQLLNQYTQETIDVLKKLSTEVDIDSTLLRDVMMTTSNNDQRIVEKVLEIYKANPHLPNLDLHPSGTDKDEIQEKSGCTWAGGYFAPDFSNLGNGSAEVYTDYRPVLLSATANGLDSEEAVEKFCEYTRDYVKQGGTYLIICRMADDVTQQTIRNLNATIGRVAYKMVNIRAMGSSGISIINDIAVAMNVKMRTELVGDYLEYREDGDYPRATITSSHFNIAQTNDHHRECLAKAIDAVRETIEELTVEQRNQAIGKIIMGRLNILSGGSVTLYVGGQTESEIKERIDRFQDVARVCKSALQAGVLQGCGYSLLQAATVLTTAHPKCNIADDYARALRAQTTFLLGDWEEEGLFTNLATGQKATTPGELNIWDAALATCTALEASVSMAIMLMDTDSIIMNSRLSEVRF